MPEPPPLPVRRLMQCNPVNPRLQAGLPMKTLHPAKHLQENFLRGVRRVRRIAYHAIHQPVHRTLKLPNQPRVGLFRARLQIGDNRRFLCPCSNRAGQISQAAHSIIATNALVLPTPIIGSSTSSPTEKSPSDAASSRLGHRHRLPPHTFTTIDS